jgi:hypothetical protein
MGDLVPVGDLVLVPVRMSDRSRISKRGGFHRRFTDGHAQASSEVPMLKVSAGRDRTERKGTMRKRTIAAIASATLGLTVLGAGAASAGTDTAPVEWAQHMAQRAGFGNGTGDPTTCPNHDGSADQVRDRTRDRLMDPDADHDGLQQQTRARIHVDVDD